MGHASSVLERPRAGRAVLIAGPTASGKSALALALAERLGGVVINADSMQVYRDLRIITARPTTDEEARVPHRLYGHVDAAEAYSVGRWLADIARVLDEPARSGHVVLVVGGTGLYFKALTNGLSAVPPIPPLVRAAIRARLEADGPTVLHDELTRRDPAAAAKLRPADRSRIARALEVLEATGLPLADWHRSGVPALIDAGRAAKVFLAPDRDELKRRIDTRFDAMLAAGALEEVRTLAGRGLDPLSPVLKAHGVRSLRHVLTGDMSLAAAAEAGKRDTKRYTKRQFTWFRHQLPDWPWVPPAQAERAILAAIAAR